MENSDDFPLVCARQEFMELSLRPRHRVFTVPLLVCIMLGSGEK